MSWLRRNVALLPPRELSRWRNIALAAWSSVSAASVHSAIEVDVQPMLDYAGREAERTGTRITMTHCVGRVVADVLRHSPDINCMIRLGRLYQRRDVDVFFPVALDSEGADLSGTVLRNVDRMTLVEVAQNLSRETFAMRKHGDEASWFLTGRGPVTRFLSRMMMRSAGFVLYTLNLWSPILAFKQDAFGSVAVTDLSPFGAEHAFPPLLPVARLPLVVGIGTVVEGGAWERERWVRVKRLRLSIVFDHRVIDGVYAARMLGRFKRVFARPEAFLGRSAADEV
jgi:pyruvate dehydrogenase E2 component (dihydrolipoamide acetyltransferase)